MAPNVVRLQQAPPCSVLRAKATNTVLADYDEQLAKLHSKFAEVSSNRMRLVKELEEARQHEAQEVSWRRQQNERIIYWRHFKYSIRLQAAIRGWLQRVRFKKFLLLEAASRKALITSPILLQMQLRDLRHTLHDLVNTMEDKTKMAVRIQAWWRMLLMSRTARVLKLFAEVRLLCDWMQAAVRKIQSWFRGCMVRGLYRPKIVSMVEKTRALKRAEWFRKLLLIVKMQRTVRAYFARKRISQRIIERDGMNAETVEILPADNEEAIDVPHIDTWRPSNCTALITALPRDHELEKMTEAGLVPFYRNSATDVVRHRIGGPAARKQDDGGCSESWGELWNLHPDGISAGFLENLDKDVWPKQTQKKVVRKRKKKCHSFIPTPPLPAPSNTERRAEARAARRTASTTPQPAEAADVTLHPLLINAPSLVLPTVPNQERRVRVADDEDGSWENSFGFYGSPVHRSKLGSKRRSHPTALGAATPMLAVCV